MTGSVTYPSKPRPNRRAAMAPQHDRLRSNPIGGNRCNRAALPLRRDAVGTSGKSGIPAPRSSPCSRRSSGSAPPHSAPRHDSSKAGESLCGYAQPAATAAISRPCGSLADTAAGRQRRSCALSTTVVVRAGGTSLDRSRLPTGGRSAVWASCGSRPGPMVVRRAARLDGPRR